jgi:hypothetical protein
MRDWHILTSGLLTYTADARFRVKHQSQPVQPPPSASIVPSRPDVSEWTLEIKFLQARDEGTYYCQVHYLLTCFSIFNCIMTEWNKCAQRRLWFDPWMNYLFFSFSDSDEDRDDGSRISFVRCQSSSGHSRRSSLSRWHPDAIAHARLHRRQCKCCVSPLELDSIRQLQHLWKLVQCINEWLTRTMSSLV